jgi:PBP1b-binding outer membrane lipoprotein LpoB
MKRVLALALVGGALLLGGCDRQQAAPSAGGDRPAATRSPAAQPPSVAGPASVDKSDKSDVDSLFSDVDKQLSSDDQTPADQD